MSSLAVPGRLPAARNAPDHPLVVAKNVHAARFLATRGPVAAARFHVKMRHPKP